MSEGRWLPQRHVCDPPIDDVPREQNGFVAYWLCDLCGSQFKVTVGEYGARWSTPDGRSGPGLSWQRVSTKP